MGIAYLLGKSKTKVKVVEVIDGNVYGVNIDSLNDHPTDAVTYIDDAIGYSPARGNNGNFNFGSWENKFPFNKIKPCLFKDGQVVGYLDKNDFSKLENGVTVDISSGSYGDVMIEFPRIYWKIERDGSNLKVRYSEVEIDNTFKCLAHTRGNIVKDKLYIGAYLGQVIDNKLRSVANDIIPTRSKTIASFRVNANNNGNGYDLMAFNQITMLQVLCLIMFRSRDLQNTFGTGYSINLHHSAGSTYNKSMYFGEESGSLQLKLFGIEDFYGNLMYFIDGIKSDSQRNILIKNDEFANDSNYNLYSSSLTGNISGAIKDVQGTTETGFIIKETNLHNVGTYYSDFGSLQANSVGTFGGKRSTVAYGGAFIMTLAYGSTYSDSSLASRLMYL